MFKAVDQSSVSRVLIKRAEALELIGIGNTTFRRLVREGKFPRPVILPGGGHRYLESEIREFLADLVNQRDQQDADAR